VNISHLHKQNQKTAQTQQQKLLLKKKRGTFSFSINYSPTTKQKKNKNKKKKSFNVFQTKRLFYFFTSPIAAADVSRTNILSLHALNARFPIHDMFLHKWNMPPLLLQMYIPPPPPFLQQ